VVEGGSKRIRVASSSRNASSETLTDRGATVDNARAMMSASPSLAALVTSYGVTRKGAPRSLADLPKTTAQAEAFAKQLKSLGYRVVGPTSVYAFMQNVGVVNDHVHGCFRASDYLATARRR
jgi:DNA-3-methyladenine glycosylase I